MMAGAQNTSRADAPAHAFVGEWAPPVEPAERPLTPAAERTWRTGEDVTEMLRSLWPWASRRKLRLFACAVCRRGGEAALTARARRAVETAERFADGAVRRWEMSAARSAAAGLPRAAAHRLAWRAASVAAARCHPRAAVGLLREVFGDPFHPACAEPAWLAWGDGVVGKLARVIYDEQSFDQLPILADALEESGCADGDILAHCRGPGPHVRGCWAVDVVLGTS